VEGGDMENCPFCVMNPDQILLETGLSYVAVNYYPAAFGSVLVIPKRHVTKFTDLTNEEIVDLILLVKKAHSTIEQKISPQGINVTYNQGRCAGQTVEHFHIQVIPRNPGDEFLNVRNVRRKNNKRIPISKDDIEVIRSFFVK
jgi:diadenosine tetraphosphate (Ap4A) HIT family hydrolase